MQQANWILLLVKSSTNKPQKEGEDIWTLVYPLSGIFLPK